MPLFHWIFYDSIGRKKDKEVWNLDLKNYENNLLSVVNSIGSFKKSDESTKTWVPSNVNDDSSVVNITDVVLGLVLEVVEVVFLDVLEGVWVIVVNFLVVLVVEVVVVVVVIVVVEVVVVVVELVIVEVVVVVVVVVVLVVVGVVVVVLLNKKSSFLKIYLSLLVFKYP